MSDHQTLSLETAIGRFGAAFVRTVCAQAHVGLSENDPDEDVRAVDADIKFAPASTRVQIKASTHYSLARETGTIQVAVKPAWVTKWRANLHPAYLVLVLVERGPDAWLAHADEDTRVNAFALWARIDDLAADATHVVLDRANRFTHEVVGAWGNDLLKAYGEEVEAS